MNKQNDATQTDWSFDKEDIVDYDAQFDDSMMKSNFNEKETTHVYVTTQRISHFFEQNMEIGTQGTVNSD